MASLVLAKGDLPSVTVDTTGAKVVHLTGTPSRVTALTGAREEKDICLLPDRPGWQLQPGPKIITRTGLLRALTPHLMTRLVYARGAWREDN